MICKECKGKGKIELFTSSVDCKACGGKGSDNWYIKEEDRAIFATLIAAEKRKQEISDIMEQLKLVANDPNLTIVSHFYA